MNIWFFGILCLISLIGWFYLAGVAFEEDYWSPAAIIVISMVISAAIASVFTISVINTF